MGAALLLPIERELIGIRIDGFQQKAYKVELAAAAGVLLVAYLLVGFYLSASVPLRRMVVALGRLADAGVAGGSGRGR